MKCYTLSTKDNPYDPFTQFDDWFKYDTEKGYNSCSLLARFAYTSDSFDDKTNQQIINDAVDEIVNSRFNFQYIKVEKEFNV
jgi:hypothetical protein